MPEVAELRRLQERMRAAITSDGAIDDAAGDVRGGGALSAFERLELYRRSHASRLLEVMRLGHPALRHLLGAELFDAFALDYLRARPSRSYTLARLAEGFAAHLDATREPGDPWAQMVIDVARLERAFAEVYDGPGSEREPAPPPLPAAPRPGLTFAPAPSLRLLRTAYRVAPYVRAVRAQQPPQDPPAAAPSFVALSRRDYVVTFTELDEAQHGALAALVAGAPVHAPSWPLVRAWSSAGLIRPIQETT